MNYTKCVGNRLALEYNEKYIDNIKLACYCEHCCMTTKRESTPYKIIQTDNGYIEIRNEIEKEIKDKIVPKTNNPNDPWSYASQFEVNTYNSDSENDSE
jgi:hypothetical protein